MNPESIFCPNIDCPARGRRGAGNIRIYSQKEKHYYCHVCQETFAARKGTVFYRLRTDPLVVMLVITLLAYGCPIQAIVAAYGFDERTVKNWWRRAGAHCQKVHEHIVGQSRLDLGQVQADEIKVKTQRGSLWLALAMMVSTRLWLGGTISYRRDMALIRRLANQVRQVALCRPLLIAVDGLPSYVRAFRLAFRSSYRNGEQGAPRKIPWPNVGIVQVVKQRQGKQFTIERRIVQGSVAMSESLITQTQARGSINTAFIERFNATFRQRLGFLARRTRALARRPQTIESGMYLLGCVYHFCTFHKSLRLLLLVGTYGRRWVKRTPAMAAGLADHCWTMHELLHFKVPTRYQPPKRRDRPRKIHCLCGIT